ncbi:hypothetical protein Tco_0142867 [Tanacetum coccineum]
MYTIKSTDKVVLEEFDLKTLIEDENAIDKEVADTVKDHKRKHDDDDDDDDDEGLTMMMKDLQLDQTRGKDPKVGSTTSKSAPAKDPVEEPTGKVIMDEQPTEDIPIFDEGHVSDPEDTDNAYMPKIPDITTWSRPMPEEERHASPEPEWVIPPIDLPEADNN